MSVGVFLVAFALGSGALALWIDQRLPRLAPGTLRAAFIHVGASIVVAQLVVPAGMGTLGSARSGVVFLTAVFAIGLPALTYSFLAAVWIMKVLHRTLRGLPH